jgi:hypothetical protein
MKYLYLVIPFLMLFAFCQSSPHQPIYPLTKLQSTEAFFIVDSSRLRETVIIDTFFDRSTIRENLADKKERNEPLIVHAYIPLCDNENQGIIPTSPSLGDGLNLKTNLYWATSGGTKAWFKKQSDWRLVYDELAIDTNVLERVIFKKRYSDAEVYFVADAYRGDRMEATVNDFLSAIASQHFQDCVLESGDTITVAGNADLVMFNGHNGMMDNIRVRNWHSAKGLLKDVVMNSCVSYGYLQYDFMNVGGYPLVRSNTLLYPGAYVLEQIIDDWVADIDPDQLCLNAGRVYCERHDCGAGTKVYQSGW